MQHMLDIAETCYLPGEVDAYSHVGFVATGDPLRGSWTAKTLLRDGNELHSAIVRCDGSISPHYASGHPETQRRLLRVRSVRVREDGCVDMAQQVRIEVLIGRAAAAGILTNAEAADRFQTLARLGPEWWHREHDHEDIDWSEEVLERVR